MHNPETGTKSYTQQERNLVANILETKIVPYMGSIFLTALDEYSQFELL